MWTSAKINQSLNYLIGLVRKLKSAQVIRGLWDSCTDRTYFLSFLMSSHPPPVRLISLVRVDRISSSTTSFITVWEHARHVTKTLLVCSSCRSYRRCSTAIRSTLFTETSRWVQKIISEVAEGSFIMLWRRLVICKETTRASGKCLKQSNNYVICFVHKHTAPLSSQMWFLERY